MDQYGCVCECVISNYRTALNCTFDVNLAIFGIVMTAKSSKSPGGFSVSALFSLLFRTIASSRMQYETEHCCTS